MILLSAKQPLESEQSTKRRSGFSSSRIHLGIFACLCLCLMLCVACASKTIVSSASPSATARTRQVLILPDVGVQDFNNLDPAQGADENSIIAMDMIYSGLVRLDQNLKVIPDQATWSISTDRKTYTFFLKSGITFSDGTPITAQTYVYSLTRALLPAVQSSNALLFLGNIVGATAVSSGQSTILSGVQAVDKLTLVIRLTQPTEYFLQSLANPIAFPVNQAVINQYGNSDWANHVQGNAVGSGPFLVTQWEHDTKMVLTPNPHYYGSHPRLTQVDIIFVSDEHTAFQAYQGGQYSFVWNILASDLNAAHGLSGFMTHPLLETDMLFFNTQMAPFNQLAVRQAFAYATDKNTLAQSVLNSSVVPAPTIIPAGIPGYQPDLQALPFARTKAVASLQSAYPDTTQLPTITFSYPNSLVSPGLAFTLQQMWQTVLGVQVKLLPVENNAYDVEMNNHQIQFGFTQWNADFADPYDVLYLQYMPANNPGNWTNSQYAQLIQQAGQTSGSAHLALYAQAEQIAITDAGWLPLDHKTMSAVIPSAVHGITLNAMGLYFGDWSGVYLT